MNVFGCCQFTNDVQSNMRRLCSIAPSWHHYSCANRSRCPRMFIRLRATFGKTAGKSRAGQFSMHPVVIILYLRPSHITYTTARRTTARTVSTSGPLSEVDIFEVATRRPLIDKRVSRSARANSDRAGTYTKQPFPQKAEVCTHTNYSTPKPAL